MSNKSVREFRFQSEFRASGTDVKPRLSGYAARYGVKTKLQPGLNETIMPGAFKRTVETNDLNCACFFNHKESQILGRVSAGTLRLREDSQGLFFDCDIDTGISYAADLYRSVQRGDISECSFGFQCNEDGDDFVDDPEERGAVLRQLKKVSVFDVSPVTFPAYGNGATNVSARSLRSMFPEGVPASFASRATASPQDVQRRLRQRASDLLDEIAREDIAIQKNRVRLAFN
jgi:hypothetical protein